MGIQIKFYPLAGDGTASGTLRTITVPSRLRMSDASETHLRDRQDTDPPGGLLQTTNLGGLLQVRLVVQGLRESESDEALLKRRLLSLQTLLELGGTIHVALDGIPMAVWGICNAGGTAWTVPALAATTGLYRYERGALGFGGTPALAANDPTVIVTDCPENHRHYGTLASWTAYGGAPGAHGFALNANDDFSHYSAESRSYIHHAQFWPALQLPAGNLNRPEVFFTTPNAPGALWTWDITLHSHPKRLFDRLGTTP